MRVTRAQTILLGSTRVSMVREGVWKRTHNTASRVNDGFCVAAKITLRSRSNVTACAAGDAQSR